MKKISLMLIVAAIAITLIAPAVYSHCQIPCGIYDDDARFAAIKENLTTVEKSMRQINELSRDGSKNVNQLVRWVQTKETHADAISDIVTAYFLTQKIKLDKNTSEEATKSYLAKLKYCHEMLHYAMKCKQTTDLANTAKLKGAMEKFHHVFHN